MIYEFFFGFSITSHNKFKILLEKSHTTFLLIKALGETIVIEKNMVKMCKIENNNILSGPAWHEPVYFENYSRHEKKKTLKYLFP